MASSNVEPRNRIPQTVLARRNYYLHYASVNCYVLVIWLCVSLAGICRRKLAAAVLLAVDGAGWLLPCVSLAAVLLAVACVGCCCCLMRQIRTYVEAERETEAETEIESGCFLES